MITSALALLTGGVIIAIVLAILMGAGLVTVTIFLPIIDIAVFIGIVYLIVKFVKFITKRGS